MNAIKLSLPEAGMENICGKIACLKLLSLVKDVSKVLERNVEVVELAEEKFEGRKKRSETVLSSRNFDGGWGASIYSHDWLNSFSTIIASQQFLMQILLSKPLTIVAA